MSGSLTSVTWTQTITGFRKVAIRRGDTVQRIALREMGDAADWYTLIALNGLTPPYVTDVAAESSSTVLLSGRDTIKIPSPPPVASGVSDADDVFGTDAQLLNGRLVISSSGDFATVSGTDNLDQAITNCLGTRLKDLVYHPDYGNGVYVLLGKGIGSAVDELAAIYVSRAIGSDTRIASVTNCTATTAGDQVSVSATAMSVDGKRLPVGTTLGGTS